MCGSWIALELCEMVSVLVLSVVMSTIWAKKKDHSVVFGHVADRNFFPED